MQRRTFLATAAAAASVSSLPGATRLPIRKAVLFGMLPSDLSIADRFQLARDAGFEAMECGTEPDQAKAEEMLAASKKAGVPIHSVMNMAHWKFPLSSPDDTVVRTSMEGMETSLRNAKLWGADAVLLVPAVVNAETGYGEAWKRSQKQIRELIPLAKELGIVIAVEEVWNKFLLSPLEFAKYVDEFNSPWVKAYFDVGNVVLYGYPQDWIRTLGPRIVKIHLKDFRFKDRHAEFVNLGEGEIDWRAIHAALAAINFKGIATVELRGGDRAYLTDVSKRVEKILSA
jgi:hexulose-6-phosphate isomerase